MQNEKKEVNLNEEKESKDSDVEIRQLETFEESRNVICFECDEKKHYVNECLNSRKIRKMKSFLITAQIILSPRDKQNNLAECVLFDQVIVATTRSEEVRKKEITAQIKKKRTILKRNERINEKHDKYLKQQKQEHEQKNSENHEKKAELREINDVEEMSESNQSKKFHDFDDEQDNEEMMKYSKDESVTMSKKSTSKNKNQSNTKIKIIKEQMKKLMTSKKLKVFDSIRIMRNKSRFDVQKMMNLMMSLLIEQLLNESQQLRKKFV
jgi:thiol:disulfide interchange protein